MIVSDASFVLEVLLETPLGLRHGDALLGQTRHAPYQLDLECASALRRLTLSGELAPERGRQILEIYGDLAFTRHSHLPLLPRIWELREAVSAYDAAYVALAEALDAPLLTCDTRLQRSHGHRANILLLN